LDAKKVIMTPEAKALGMGYEEMGNVFMHDPALYTPEGFAKMDGLKDFIRDNLFVKKDIIDYDTIRYKLIL
jgi:hypothetical protein